MNGRETLLTAYRKMDIDVLIETRFYGNYEPSTIEQVIKEKIKELKKNQK